MHDGCRGRGKSAALGLAIAGALSLGYSNIFVSAPSPENLRTLFEFIFKARAPDLAQSGDKCQAHSPVQMLCRSGTQFPHDVTIQ